MDSLFFRVMASITRKIDPILEKYRPPKAPAAPAVPQTEKELISLLKRIPRAALEATQREQIITTLGAKDLRVADVMAPRRQIALIHTADKLGPLLLDKLHRTGAKIFPVIDEHSQICGVARSDIFDIHKISEDSNILNYTDRNVVYVAPDYTLDEALRVFLRNRTDYCLVVNEKMQIKGFLTIAHVVEHLLCAARQEDDFSQDSDPMAVASRHTN